MYTVIRPWCLSDSTALAECLNNTHILQNLRDGLPYPYTERDAREYISSILRAGTDDIFAFAIVRENQCVGSITVTRGNNIYRLNGELGYYVAEPYWGHGLATRAVQEICSYVFTHSDIIRIQAEVFAFNAASCRVLEKSGFTCEGTLRRRVIKNDDICDVKVYALLCSEI